MPSNQLFTRRDFSFGLASLFPFLATSHLPLVTALPPLATVPPDEIIHNAEAIHQEVVFKASPRRIYDALTITKQFDKVVQLSAAMASGMITAKLPTEINAEEGGAFSIFGGHIVGRQVELVPAERIVQAWRVVDWSPGIYSIARFELSADGSGTKLVLDHTGFPIGGAAHYAEGWHVNYWEPLEKSLA